MMNEQRSKDPGVNLNASISAWLDSELHADDANRILNDMARRPEHGRNCESYWLIGDVLRGGPMTTDLSADFVRRVMTALQSEPTVLAPVMHQPNRGETETPRWMPIAAAVAGVLVVGWMALSVNKPSSDEQNTAAAQNAVTPVVAPAIASARGGFNDDRAYTLAHQAYGSGAALPNVAMYVRTVGAEQVDTGR